ncbi:unnamed protein product [Ranitomeya imitator]|uniref:Dihydropteridine reductase n=1 Tax=Ranitomeya imitator TaxID=111125 RepID=A0ABN9L249_9NEOB|nr:unnamed protein product [Ranitomeya imitator]
MAAASEARRVLVYGGRGALGSRCVDYFMSRDWWVASIDVTENAAANANVVVKPSDSFSEQAEEVSSAVDQLLGGQKVDAILCVAGGWAGGSAKAKSFYKNCDLMWKQSVWTSTISSHLATKHLKEGGLLTLSGANAGLSATPGMIAYGMAKAAVHQLCQSLGGGEERVAGEFCRCSHLAKYAKENLTKPDAILKKVLCAEKSTDFQKKNLIPTMPGRVNITSLYLDVLCVVFNKPYLLHGSVTLDTPANRASMPDADFTSWTSLDFIAE